MVTEIFWAHLEIAEVDSMLTEMLALLFKTMNNESDEVASSVLGFAGAYVNRLKTVGKVNSTQVEHLEVFLQIIRNKVFPLCPLLFLPSLSNFLLSPLSSLPIYHFLLLSISK
jgi:hypothetical protein